ncbi:hypothetical protein [Lepagella muris]|jgi:hypothetical protein|uniref:Uncharacterized protein n=1 Tax=Lepagella muris TaxID=3032870 RepID=A0AC61RK06_9BACT|nr:hypothetical protein [Lepagella muris]ROT08079.1 hypothetical protein EEL33_05975 [Muribaculaceae bacterium Isolate-037 (Harlan)]TGY80351.1 hypothetical protein E5331_03710 [Lepagella muris]THG52890.1 hypothetical protein E5984_06190 [Bacteroidales bacterium]TKC58660.1 hypothetical protein E5359_009840 [Bacteroidales bacterium]
MKIIYNKIIPFGRGMYVINLFGVLFAKGPCNKFIINHELIHTAQIKELGYIPFYILYVIEWVFRLFQYGSSLKAYFNISFEREAYACQDDLDYLKTRRHYSFIRYVKRGGQR